MVYQSGAARGAARLVRPKITVIIRPKCKHFVLYSNSYLGVLNNYIFFIMILPSVICDIVCEIAV